MKSEKGNSPSHGVAVTTPSRRAPRLVSPTGETVPPKAAEGISFQKIPTPCPLPRQCFLKEGAALAREGDLIFLKIKFFQGAPPPSPQGHA